MTGPRSLSTGRVLCPHGSSPANGRQDACRPAPRALAGHAGASLDFERGERRASPEAAEEGRIGRPDDRRDHRRVRAADLPDDAAGQRAGGQGQAARGRRRGRRRDGHGGDARRPAGPGGRGTPDPPPRCLSAAAVEAIVDLATGGRVASLLDRRPRAAYARTATGRSSGARSRWRRTPAGSAMAGSHSKGGIMRLPATLPPHAIHGTVLDRPLATSSQTVRSRTDLGPDWPFAGRAVQRFELSADSLMCRLEVHADEPMPASIGWHPWFVRRLEGVPGELELDLDAGAMLVRDADGIATDRRVEPPPGPWDDCFVDLRRPPLLRWPGFLELIGRGGLPGLGDLHGARGRALRRAADGATRRTQSRAGDRRAGSAARGDDDLALAPPRRLRVSRRWGSAR